MINVNVSVKSTVSKKKKIIVGNLTHVFVKMGSI